MMESDDEKFQKMMRTQQPGYVHENKLSISEQSLMDSIIDDLNEGTLKKSLQSKRGKIYIEAPNMQPQPSGNSNWRSRYGFWW
jgi:hypothetical protein